mgnify:CR=1 FL=1
MKNIQNADPEKEQLHNEIGILQQQVSELSAKLKWYEEQNRLNQAKLFGKASEQTPPEQLNFFNEVEIEAKAEQPEPTMEEITYRRKKREGQKEELLKDLPVEIIEYRLSEEEQVCSCCGGALHEMSTEVRTEVKIIPAQAIAVKHVRYVYGCRDCEKNNIETPIITTKMPSPVIPKSLASASAVSYVIEQKFMQGVPLYRQEQQFERLGLALSRQTMSNWLLSVSNRLLRPLYERMREHLLEQDILHADETTLQVLKEDGRAATSTSYMWMYRTGREGPAIVLYDYQTTRAGKHAEQFLKDFSGWLHADGYAGYHVVKKATLVGCWAHARRNFAEALSVLPVETRNQPSVALEGMNFCNQLFAIEREFADATPADRFEGRLQKSKPVLDSMAAWLKQIKPKILPKSLLGKAVQYCFNQWDYLTNFLEDGRLEIDNNRSERAIKPFVIGRKNWMFCASSRGATASATIYSIVETAKENDLNVTSYLNWLLDKLANVDLKDPEALDQLMPWAGVVPECLRLN